MDPVTSAALIEAGFSILGRFMPSEELEAMEKEGKANRKLERLALLLGMLEQSATVQSRNAAAKTQAKFLAPQLADLTYKRNAPLRETELANQASGRYLSQNPEAMGTMQGTDVSSVVIQNAADYQRRKQEASSRASQYTPENLYTPAVDPVDLMKKESPNQWLAMTDRPQYTNERGDGLDDIEAQILNRKAAEGYSPQELAKMLATFKRPEVQKGVTNG